MSKNTVRKYFYKLMDLLFVGLVILALTSCASSGGGSSLPLPEQQSYTPPAQNSPSNDKRHSFETFTSEYNPNASGYSENIVVTYSILDYTATGLPEPTEKYYIEDYGFLNINVLGTHPGFANGQETQDPGPYNQSTRVFEADLNGDEHMDFYVFSFVGGYNTSQQAYNPDSQIFTFINDGNGHFILQDESFCFMGTNCNNNTSPTSGLVVDLNGDGIDDFFGGSTLLLSNNGKLEDKSSTLPASIWFNNEVGGNMGPFAHDVANGDIDGDGDQDVFVPIFARNSGTDWGDGFTTNNFEPWAMLINDGTGNFVASRNFPTYNHQNSTWATTATVADFDNDGYGDVAVGWQYAGNSHNNIPGGPTNSAGAVYYNNGNNDWRNDVVALPANYFGAIGGAIDMEAFDIDGDGFVDIVMSVTPTSDDSNYYVGNMIQVFKNGANRTWTDITSTANPNTKYANGNPHSNEVWNGQVFLTKVDFDKDGDLDIVSTGVNSYVLLNNNGVFELYDDFPSFDSGHLTGLFPVEIDGKDWYDFVGSTVTVSDTDSDNTFWLMMDPVNVLEQMANEIANKPTQYAQTVFENKSLFNDIKNITLYDSKVFYADNNYDSILGYSKNFGEYGLLFGKTEGGGVVFFDTQIDKYHVGLGYMKSDMYVDNPGKYYGTGNAKLDVDTINLFAERLFAINNNWYLQTGVSLYNTTVDSFTEQNSNFNAEVNKFSLNDIELYSDLTARFNTSKGTTFISLGVSNINSLSNTNIQFNGLKSEFNSNETVFRATISHAFNNVTAYLKADTINDNVQFGISLSL